MMFGIIPSMGCMESFLTISHVSWASNSSISFFMATKNSCLCGLLIASPILGVSGSLVALILNRYGFFMRVVAPK